MNQDDVRRKLLDLSSPKKEFSIIFSGKKSKRVNGLYKPATCEIVIHNKNFDCDNLLMYTAIHEFAHHLHRESGNCSAKAHDTTFWALFNTLLDEAVDKGIYQRSRSESLTTLILEANKIQEEINVLQRRLGLLLEAIEKESNNEAVRFEDIIHHDLQLSTVTAKQLRSIGGMSVSSLVGLSIDATKQLVRTPKNEEACAAIYAGKSIAQIKKISSKIKNENEDKLQVEKIRIEKTIESLNRRLTVIIEELDKLNSNNNPIIRKVV